VNGEITVPIEAADLTGIKGMKGIKHNSNIKPQTSNFKRYFCHCEEPGVFEGDAAISGAVLGSVPVKPAKASSRKERKGRKEAQMLGD
jgi:hypothetical protein